MNSVKRALLFSIVAAFATACGGGGGGGGAAGGAGTPVTNPTSPKVPSEDNGSPEVSKPDSRAVWNDEQGTCLNDNGEPAMNAQPLGTNAECVDFSNQDLTGKDFSGVNLTGANFSNSTLADIKLDGAKLAHLTLDNAEIQNDFLLKWLTTGHQPAPEPPAPAVVVAEEDEPAAPAETEDEPIIVSDNTPAPPAPPELVIETHPPVVQPPASTPNLAEYIDQVKSAADLNTMASKINLTSLQLRRALERSLVRITNKGIKEDKADIKAARLAGDSAGTTKADNELQADKKYLEERKTKMIELTAAINKVTGKAKENKQLSQRLAKAARLAKKLTDKGLSVSDVSSTKQNLEKKKAELEAQVVALNQQRTSLQGQVENLTKKIESMGLQMDEFDAKIAATQGELKNLKKVNKKSDAVAAATLALQSLKAQREALKTELAGAREQKAEPQEQIKSVNLQIKVAEQDIKAVNKQLKDLELYTMVASLLQ